jgi:hypothetical protein
MRRKIILQNLFAACLFAAMILSGAPVFAQYIGHYQNQLQLQPQIHAKAQSFDLQDVNCSTAVSSKTWSAMPNGC